MMQAEIRIREAVLSDSAIILHHRRSMFRDMGEGTVEELDRMVEVAGPSLACAWPTVRIVTGWRWMARTASAAAAGCYYFRGQQVQKTHALFVQ